MRNSSLSHFIAFLRPYAAVLISALLLRLLLMPFLFHPDIKTHYFHAQFLADGIVNIYRFIAENKDQLAATDTFNYPPLAYYFLGIWDSITKPLIGADMSRWMANWGPTWFTDAQLFRMLFILKIPYLVCDFVTGVTLIYMAKAALKKRVAILWFFNPVSLYIIYGLGTFDIVPTALTMLAISLLLAKKTTWSAVLLGCAIALKVYPLLFLPFFVLLLVREKKLKDALGYAVVSCAILPASAIFSFPEVLSLGGSGLLNRILAQGLTIGAIRLPIFVIIYFILLAGAWFVIKWMSRQNFLFFSVLVTLVAVYIVTTINPQWLLWILPLVAYFVATDLWLLVLLVIAAVGYFGQVIAIQDRFLLLGITSPIFPNIYDVGQLEKTILAKVSIAQLSLWSYWCFVIGLSGIVVGSVKKQYEKEV